MVREVTASSVRHWRKRMRDTSDFLGVKELCGERGDFRFMDEFANAWRVLRRYGHAFVMVGYLSKHKRESNKALYNRAADIWENYL